jgi:hypothetical protein
VEAVKSAARLYEEAEELAARLAYEELTQQERAEGGDIIRDLLADARELRRIVESGEARGVL